MSKEEVWKPIKGFEGLYEVSNLGNIKSFPRKYTIKKEKILSSCIMNNGYLCVALSKNHKGKTYLIHRLVAETFIPNPNNYSCINHKDGNKLNNKIDNLEWCSYSYNSKEAYRIGLKKSVWKGKFDKENSNSKKINQYDLEGNLIKKWNSTMEIERQLGINHSNISACCKGRYKKSNGYIWRYINE